MSQTQGAIAQRIVERLGGRLWAASPRPDGLGPQGGQEDGTAFAFTLPIVRNEGTGSSSSSIEEAQ